MLAIPAIRRPTMSLQWWCGDQTSKGKKLFLTPK